MATKKITPKKFGGSKSVNRKSGGDKKTKAHEHQLVMDLSSASTEEIAQEKMATPQIDHSQIAGEKSLPVVYKKNQKDTELIAKLGHYARLMRWHKPIGIGLLLWPTLWSLWIAAKGLPRWDLLAIFIAGVVVMRSAGCVINDFADRKIDSRVARTQDRPLATGAVSTTEALLLFAVLCGIALGLVLLTDPFTIKLSLGGLALAVCYPFMKRHTHLPQVVLGAAFAWSIPMAFAAQTGSIPHEAWVIYCAVILWTVVYDTFYAMVDRDDDLNIGVKSTAILFGEQDKIITAALQILTFYALILVGERFGLGLYYKLSLLAVAALFVYQQWLIRFREKSACFKAFLNNNWVGLAVFIGIVADFAVKKI